LKAAVAHYHSFAVVTKLLSLNIDLLLIPTTTSAFRMTYIYLFTNNQKHQQSIVTLKKQHTHKQD